MCAYKHGWGCYKRQVRGPSAPSAAGAQARAAERAGPADEMIVSAGDYLERALAPAAQRLAWERAAVVALAVGAVGAGLGFCIGRRVPGVPR